MRHALLAVSAATALALAAACSPDRHHTIVITLEITGISPATGTVGTTVTLDGDGFGATQGASTVSFESAPATIVSWSDHEIVTAVPAGAFPGNRLVTITKGSTSATAQFLVVLPPRLYVDDTVPGADNSVSVYAIPASGPIAPIVGSPFTTGAGGFFSFGGGSSIPLVVHAPTRRLFVTNTASIAVFDIDAVTGSLSAVAGSPFATGTAGLLGLAVTGAGDRLYAARCSGSGAVLGFSISSTGALAAIAGSPYAIPFACPDSMALTDNDGSLIVNDDDADDFADYVLHADGTLSSAKTFARGTTTTYAVGVAPATTFVYFPSRDIAAIGAIDVQGAIATPITGAPFSIAGGIPHGAGIAFSADGTRAFVAAGGTPGAIESLALDIAGAPSPIGMPLALPGATDSCIPALGGDGRTIWILDDLANTLRSVLVATNGTLSLGASPLTGDVATGLPQGFAVTP